MTRGAPLPKKWDHEADVIVIGSGTAGLPAAIVAAEGGAKVMVMELMPMTAPSLGLINVGPAFGGTDVQKEQGINDSPEEYYKDGVELAREEKLPELVLDAIRQHHGTTVMAYFYQKALDTDSHSSVNKDDFRYPGPKPMSKEAATLMLADTVEPACRSLKDPTPTNIRNMVVKLIDTRTREGELDDSGLTLNDVARIKEKFITILTGIYHKRIAYPGQEKGEDKESEALVKPA